MEKGNLNYLLIIFAQRKMKKQNLFHQEVIFHVQMDVKLHVTLLNALRIACYLTQKEKMLLHLMIICIYP